MKNSTSSFLLGTSFFVFSFAAYGQLPVLDSKFTPQGIEMGDPADNQLNIHQFDDKAIVHWDSFSIDEGYLVKFNQEPHQAILNRVTGETRSELLGELKAGGTVWLINPNGVLIGDGARIQTQSFIASTLDLDNEQFMNGDGPLELLGDDSSGAIINKGKIEALGGDVILVAREVTNNGELKALDGAVRLAAGNEIELTFRLGENSGVAVKSGISGSSVGVNHQGIIEAAHAELVAAGGNIYGMAVNVSGSIVANSKPNDDDYATGNIHLISEGGGINVSRGAYLRTEAGGIFIDAGDSPVGQGGGDITVAGHLDTSAQDNERWSKIYMDGDRVHITSTATLNASSEGGTAGFIDIRGVGAPMTELRIDGGALLDASGNYGEISLEARDIFVAGKMQVLGEGGSVRLADADKVTASDAQIQAQTLRLNNVAAADISNSGNSFQELTFIFSYPTRSDMLPGTGDLMVNAGAGPLRVNGDGDFQYKNLTLISESDLLWDHVFVGATEQATLASLQGRLKIESPDTELFADAKRIRLYSKQESELDGLEPDNLLSDVVFPDDPDQQSRTVLYRIVDAPEPDTEENPNDQDEDEPRRAAMESLGRDSAHQQQTHQGMHFIVTVDPATGLPALFAGAGLGGGRVDVTDDLPRPALPPAPIYSGQDGPDDVPTGGSGSDPDLLLEQLLGSITSDADVLQALLNAKQEIDAENAEFLEALRNAMGGDDQSGSGPDFNDGEQLSAYRNTLNNLINNIAQRAAQRGALTSEQLEQIVNEANQRIRDGDRDYDLNRDVPAIDRTAGVDDAAEQRRQQMRDEAEQRRQQQQQQLQDRRDQIAQQNSDLLDRLEQARQQQEEQNRQALEERKQQAEDRYRQQLSEAEQRRFEEQEADSRQEQEPVAAAPQQSGDQQRGSTDDQDGAAADEQQRRTEAQRLAEEQQRERQQQALAERQRQLEEQQRLIKDRQQQAQGEPGTWQSSPVPSPVNMGGAR